MYTGSMVFQVIVVAFREFVLLGSNDCQTAVLRYYDGDSRESTPRIFCGSKLPDVIRSSRNIVIFALHFSGTHSWSGFRLDYAGVHNSSRSRYPVFGTGNVQDREYSFVCTGKWPLTQCVKYIWLQYCKAFFIMLIKPRHSIAGRTCAIPFHFDITLKLIGGSDPFACCTFLKKYDKERFSTYTYYSYTKMHGGGLDVDIKDIRMQWYWTMDVCI